MQSSGAPTELEPFVVALNASFASELGGALTSLKRSGRPVACVVRNGGTHPVYRQALRGEVGRTLPARAVPKRTRMNDAEMILLIQREQRTQHRSRSALLRVLREKGYAVEQSRFGKIYNEITEVSSAS